MTNMFRSLLSDESGQGLVEYALIISLVSVALVVGLSGLATNISSTFTTIGSKL